MTFACEHCHTPLPQGARTCEQCGAPVLGATFGGDAKAAPAGFERFTDRWRGLSVLRPEGWRALFPRPESICFVEPEGRAWLELIRLPPNPVVDAEQQARLFLGGLPGVEIRPSGTASPTQAAVAFRNAEVEGSLVVRLSPAGCLAVYARRKRDAEVELEEPVRRVLESLSSVEPLPRQPYICPHEQSFQLQVPQGWQVQSTIHMGNNQRVPWFRVFADPSGQISAAREPEMAIFLDVPDAGPAPAGEGFFAKMARLAREAEAALSGGVAMPFQGLRPVAERYFFPKIAERAPGAVLVGVEDYGNPHAADMRVSWPDGRVTVFQLEGMGGLDPMDPRRWIGAMVSWYSAPAAVIDGYEPLLRGVLGSFQQNPRWQQAETGRMNAVNAQRSQQAAQQHQHNMAMLRSQAASSTAMHQANMAASDARMASWQQQQAVSDQSHHNTIQGIREVADFTAPAGSFGTPVVEASMHFDKVWSDPQGQLWGGDWSVEVPPDWTTFNKR